MTGRDREDDAPDEKRRPRQGQQNPAGEGSRQRESPEDQQQDGRRRQSRQDQPQRGQPRQEQPQRGQPRQGQPQQGQSRQGQPQQSQPQQGQPRRGQSRQGQPQQGGRQPQQGQPRQGHPQQGHPQGPPQRGQQQQGRPQQQTHPRRQQVSQSSFFENIAWKRAVPAGFGAFILGFALIFGFVIVEGATHQDEFGTNNPEGEVAVQGPTSTPDIDVGSAVSVIGWLFHSAHFVDLQGESDIDSASIDFLGAMGDELDLTIPVPIWRLVPVVVLTGTGYLVASRSFHSVSAADSAKQ